MKKYEVVEVLNKKDKAELQWVMRALTKDVARPALGLVHIEEGKAVATDGKRLHMASLEDGTHDGNYLPIKYRNRMLLQREEVLVFPIAWKDVLPNKDKMVCLHKHLKGGGEDVGLTCYGLAMAAGMCVEPRFVADALSDKGTTMEAWVAQTDPKINPMAFISDKRTCVFMPMRTLGYEELFKKVTQ